MTLYEQWKDIAYVERTQEEYDAFWSDYLAKEQKNYEHILENKDEKISGTFAELAELFNMDLVTFAGFLDGINTSLVNTLDLDSLTEESPLDLAIDMEKLYYNMLDAKADWLYTLPQWDTILTEQKRKEIKKSYNQTKIVVKGKKIGRNEPCPCGSGKKYKQCCLNKQ
ncbi:SEC-C domain-containing protein [Vallitalea pronyensis]|uniref:SEC-C domain-containing protein n=1 Tax=Vallitalea pronyensis TaxID=1348613 RepID=A0A8J8SI45_9FIRM|nr:SEC-C metal-binding domain-containing protein [Vallitalea pronyensis]QUI24074.1 SEC-C domain-containing protein [Vallitalea pronyensis]